MNRSVPFIVGCCVLLAAAPAFAQSRAGGSGGRSGGGSGGAGGSSGFGDFGGGFTQQGMQFGDLSQFGQSTGINALSSGIGSPATGLGLPPLSGGSSTSRTGRSGSPNSSFGSVSQNRGGAGGGLSGGNRAGGGGSATGRSVTGLTGRNSGGRTGNMFGMNGRSGMSGMNSTGRGGRNGGRAIGVQQAVRPVIQVSLDDLPPALSPPAVAQAAATSLAQNQLLPSLQQAEVNVDVNGVATVRGTARTTRERTLAAALLSLEPGVRAVKNEVVVPPQASLPTGR